MDGSRACPHCGGEIRLEAVLCRHCRRGVDAATLRVSWERDPRDRQVAGVSAMLGRALGVSPTLVRLAFLASTLFAGGFGLYLYLLLWVCTPLAGRKSPVARVMAWVESILFPRRAADVQDDVAPGGPAEGGGGGQRSAAGPMPEGPAKARGYRSRYDADDEEWSARWQH